MVVTKKSIIGDILDYDVETAQFFFAIGMHCLGLLYPISLVLSIVPSVFL